MSKKKNKNPYPAGRWPEWDPFTGKGKKPKDEPGEYRFIDIETRAVEYVGISGRTGKRIREHIRSGKLKKGCVVAHKSAKAGSSIDALRAHEKMKIQEHSPSLNRSGGGEGNIRF